MRFWLCVVLAVANLAATLYCAVGGVKSWAGVVMSAFWILLAWSHARRSSP